MSMRMNVPSSPARPTSRATFAYAVSSSKDRPRCVSLRATFAFSFSATSRSMICSYSAVTAAAPSASGIASPRSVVFAYRPASLSLRRTATHESSVSPATKRAAPMRRPCRCTRCWRRELSAACRMAARESVETVVRRSVKRCRDYIGAMSVPATDPVASPRGVRTGRPSAGARRSRARPGRP